MKKSLKITAITLSTIVVLLSVATLILGLITVRPLKDLNDYERAYVIKSFTDSRIHTNENKQTVDKGFDTVKFSILRSVLESNTDYGIKLNEVEVDEDKTEPVRFRPNDAATEIKAAKDEFMLEFSYAKGDNFNYKQHERFKDENGNSIYFDNLIIIISAPSEKRLQTVRMYPYILFNLDNGINPLVFGPDENHHISPDNYYIYEFSAKMYTAELYNILLESFTPTDTSGNA